VITLGSRTASKRANVGDGGAEDKGADDIADDGDGVALDAYDGGEMEGIDDGGEDGGEDDGGDDDGAGVDDNGTEEDGAEDTGMLLGSEPSGTICTTSHIPAEYPKVMKSPSQTIPTSVLLSTVITKAPWLS
jgi:hypothetical protein